MACSIARQLSNVSNTIFTCSLIRIRAHFDEKLVSYHRQTNGIYTTKTLASFRLEFFSDFELTISEFSNVSHIQSYGKQQSPIYYSRSTTHLLWVFCLTCGHGNENRRTILGTLIKHLQNIAPVGKLSKTFVSQTSFEGIVHLSMANVITYKNTTRTSRPQS